jgi:catechol 2,3-dioxygenase-like lactoylglutathione lyase family enzyme
MAARAVGSSRKPRCSIRTRSCDIIGRMNRLIPELDVEDLDRSLAFYVGLIGFRILYERPEERFAFLEREGAQMMLEEAAGPGRRLRTAPLERPFGRGAMFHVVVADVEALYVRVREVGFESIIPLEERWYRRDDIELGNRQFTVADPDGYVLRFFSGLGRRTAGR